MFQVQIAHVSLENMAPTDDLPVNGEVVSRG